MDSTYLEQYQASTCPGSPTTPMTRSFDLSSSTIDELTSVLADLNRIPTPASPSYSMHPPTCCCGHEECDNTIAWLDVRSKLESRLILSAEVGQALLQKHEAYVRRVERQRQKRSSFQQANLAFNDDSSDDLNSEQKLSREYDHLAREKAEIEKRLNHALVNNEVTEVSNKTLLQELQEAKETISRLTAHHARSMGWDARLNMALKERDDMQQERDGESQRALLAESRFAALKEKTAKLQTEVRRLQESLEEKRHCRLESSQTILNEAKLRLETVKSSVGLTAKAEQDELTNTLETLVNDNETLKRDNAELQRLLAESREDLHTLQVEVDEYRATPYPTLRSNPPTPLSRHFHSNSITVAALPSARRTFSPELSPRQRLEPLTPDSSRRPLSPLDSLIPPDRWGTFAYPGSRPRHSSNASRVSYEVEGDAANVDESPEMPKGGNRPLLLLSRSRGVQTDPVLNLPFPSPLPSYLSNFSDGRTRSASSSMSETLSSNTSALFERAAALCSRMSQADALTLTTRLKRQNLKGADLGHLSRTTVSNIVAEAIELRGQFRSLLEDEKIVATCTRKDLRVLFKLLKDMFMEMGVMRVTLNDVIFNPSSAGRISEMSLNPNKIAVEKEQQTKDLATRIQSAGNNWIAPLSRLFAPAPTKGEPGSQISRANSSQGPPTMGRLAPKLGPALAASTTTVNVEFSGAGVGRATTLSLSPPSMITVTALPDAKPTNSAAHSTAGTASVMKIFAGAPKPQPVDPEWVVLPNPRATPRRAQSQYFNLGSQLGSATVGRSAMRTRVNRLSRNVDAVIDSPVAPSGFGEESPVVEDEVPELPEPRRPLRRRGLSDSSIRSSFTTHARDGDDLGPSPPHTPPKSPEFSSNASASASSALMPWYGASVFQALSKTVNNLRIPSGGTDTVYNNGGPIASTSLKADSASNPGTVNSSPTPVGATSLSDPALVVSQPTVPPIIEQETQPDGEVVVVARPSTPVTTKRPTRAPLGRKRRARGSVSMGDSSSSTGTGTGTRDILDSPKAPRIRSRPGTALGFAGIFFPSEEMESVGGDSVPSSSHGGSRTSREEVYNRHRGMGPGGSGWSSRDLL